MKFTINSFNGGMRLDLDPTKINAGEYPLLINGRTRSGNLRPVKLPTEISFTVMDGATEIVNPITQGIYGYDRYLLLFAGGRALYLDTALTPDSINQIPVFSMSQTEDYIYAQAVPASTVNFKRELTTTDKSSSVSLNDASSVSPVCVLCQDGVSRPNIILPFTGGVSAYVARDYSDWNSNTTQEYVPIGKFMCYQGAILYLASYDASNNLTQIFRSVSGRPLDFMVNIQSDGSGGGEASTVAHNAFSFPLTGLYSLGLSDGQFLATSVMTSALVSPDFTNKIFGEPQFSNTPLFSTGALNPFSFVDINGDTAFIDLTGIKSFNAVKQLTSSSNSNPFSKTLAKLFEGISQTYTCAYNYDNYAFFAVTTIYGPGVIVYDILTSTFVSLDIYPGVGLIKQFASTYYNGVKRLFFITTSNKLYEMFIGSYATIQLYLGEFSSNDATISQTDSTLFLVFTQINSSGTVSVTPFSDKVAGTQVQYTLNSSSPGAVSPCPVPYQAVTSRDSERVTFNFLENYAAWKYGYLISWNFDAELSNISLESIEDNSDISSVQQL